PIRSLQKFETEAKKAIEELGEFSKDHDVTVFCENSGELSRLEQLLDQDAPGLTQQIKLAIGYLHRGFVYGDEKAHGSAVGPAAEKTHGGAMGFGAGARPIAVLGHHELFHRYEVRR